MEEGYLSITMDYEEGYLSIGVLEL